jgi:transmembrane sensor
MKYKRMMMKNDMDAKLLKYLDGEQISENERTEIENWLANNSDNKVHYKLLKKISEKKRYLDQLEKVDAKKNWTRFQHAVKRNSHEIPVFSFARRKRVYLSAVAAAILILILTGASIYLARFKDASRIQQVDSMQNNTEIKLADGSFIVINKGSVLSYPEHINRRKREVKLNGEAYFEVAKRNASPFYVYLQSVTIRVLGTSFNIKEEEDGQVVVSVLTGEVIFFEAARESNSLKLEAGQKGIFNSIGRKFEKQNSHSENFLYWKTGKLSFEDKPLDLVFQDLEDNFNTRIIVEDRAVLQNRLTSSCEEQDLDEILNELSILFKIRYFKKGDTIYIQSGH